MLIAEEIISIFEVIYDRTSIDKIEQVKKFIASELDNLNDSLQIELVQIMNNVKEDQFLGKEEILLELFNNFFESISSGDPIKKVFKNLCHKYKLYGYPIKKIPMIFSSLKGLDLLSNTLGKEENQREYKNKTNRIIPERLNDIDKIRNLFEKIALIESNKLLTENQIMEKQKELLKDVPLGFFIQWTTFHCQKDEYCCAFKNVDDKYNIIFNYLGLDNDLKTDKLLLFTLQFLEDSIIYEKKTIHKPTFLDAGWRSQWKAENKSEYGLTRPYLGDNGWPEIVHYPMINPILVQPIRFAK